MKHKLLLFVVVVPNIISLGYYWGVASPTYTSTAQMMVETTLPHSAMGQSSLTSYAPDRVKNVYTMENILRSWSAYQYLSKNIPLQKWSADGDFVTSYGGLMDGFNKNDIQLWHYYRDHLRIKINKDDGIMSISYTGYRSHQAQHILQKVLQYGKSQIDISGKMVRESRLKAAQKSAASAEASLSKANGVLAAYRSAHHLYDPKMQYESALHTMSGLMLKASEIEAQQSALLHSAPNSKNLGAYQQGADLLLGQIQNIKKQAISETGQANLYPVLAANQRISEKLLMMAQENVQKAMTEASSPSFICDMISEPSHPHGASGPDRLLDSFIVLIVTFLIWSFLR